MGFDNYCNNLSHDFIGKNALKKILKNGIEKKIKGISFDGSPTPPKNCDLGNFLKK